MKCGKGKKVQIKASIIPEVQDEFTGGSSLFFAVLRSSSLAHAVK